MKVKQYLSPAELKTNKSTGAQGTKTRNRRTVSRTGSLSKDS